MAKLSIHPHTKSDRHSLYTIINVFRACQKNFLFFSVSVQIQSICFLQTSFCLFCLQKQYKRIQVILNWQFLLDFLYRWASVFNDDRFLFMGFIYFPIPVSHIVLFVYISLCSIFFYCKQVTIHIFYTWITDREREYECWSQARFQHQKGGVLYGWFKGA